MKTLIYTIVGILIILAIKEIKTNLKSEDLGPTDGPGYFSPDCIDSVEKSPTFIDSIKYYAKEDRNGNVSLVPYVDSIDIDTTQLFTNHSEIK